MIGNDGRWITLASDFPATLNKEARETELQPNESPDAYGMDLDTPGLLAAISTEPTGTARILDPQASPTATGGETLGAFMFWLYNRLWGIDVTNSNHLRYGAPDYRDTYFAQRTGLLTFTESSEAIVNFVPAGSQGLVVVKADSSFYVPNAGARDGKFIKTDVNQGFVCDTAAQINSFEGVAYCVNANGVFSFDGQTVTELTRNIRNDLSPFTTSTITFDHDKKWLIGGPVPGNTNWAIDLTNGKLFDYSQDAFRWTSRALRGEDHEPLTVDRIALMVDHSSTAGGQLAYQLKIEEQDWTDAVTVDLDYTSDQYSRVEIPLDTVEMCRKWQIRFTSLSTNVRIKEIQVHNTLAEAEAFSA